MSDVGRIYGAPRKGRKTAVNEGSEMQARIAALLQDPEIVTEPVLKKVMLGLGTKSREDSVALVRSDLQAARLTAKIIDSNPPGQEGSIPPMSSPQPAAPATAPKGKARLKF